MQLCSAMLPSIGVFRCICVFPIKTMTDVRSDKKKKLKKNG